ncbi:enoyl-CoA hydratase/isomerase family protein [Variovorax boronicumulans]|uniref:enoyl-CoA hydratase/isomerase family protein n=1 Tax=Variovorax boronicumulans TaxID=436515 RepID=UPI001C590BBB
MNVEFHTLSLSRTERVLRVRLDRRQVRNAMNLAMCIELRTLFEGLRHDEETDAVILEGEGSSFCAGIDVKEFGTQSADWQLMRRNEGLDTYLAIERAPMPVAAIVHGPVVGAGCELMLSCDFAVASDDATFRWPEAALGAPGATQRLPRVVGSALARDLLFTCRRIDAREAQSMGLITRIVRASELSQASTALAAEFAYVDAPTARLMKRSTQLGAHLPISAAVDIERMAIQVATKRA